MWILYSFLAAISHALANATTKKALQQEGIINFFGFGMYIISGIFFLILLLVATGTIIPHITNYSRFWMAILTVALLETISMFFQYKAVAISDLSYLMPFFSLTAVFTIIPSFLMLGELPSLIGFLGIVTVVVGAIIMNYKNKKNSIAEEKIQNTKINNRKGLMYFLIALAIASLIPPIIKISVVESSAIFTSFMISWLVGIAFLIMIFIFKEREKVKEILVLREKKNIILLIIIVLAGIITAIEFATMNTAFGLANVAYVMGIKRTMPFFAFLIGYFFCKEKTDVLRKIFATTLMVAGAIFIMTFG
jgi:drug/metabolite transporter (DMT)-like permease